MNITIKQKEILLNNLKNHADLVKGRIDRKNESRRKMNDMWNEIAENINSANVGPRKSGQEWAKTWKDIKSYILKKEAKRRSCIQGTGGGSPPKIAFSDFEEDVLQFLTPEAAGMENIPEGGIIDAEQNALQNCDLSYNNCIIEEQNMLLEVEEENTENASPNINIRKRKIINTQKNKPKEKSTTHHLLYSILEIQEIKLKMKKKELKIRKKTLKMQKDILIELKKIKSILQAQSTEFIV